MILECLAALRRFLVRAISAWVNEPAWSVINTGNGGGGLVVGLMGREKGRELMSNYDDGPSKTNMGRQVAHKILSEQDAFIW
jgi:hypothetical protein